ncbi:hypothetical protein COY65_01815 [Candidatus Jorgensenbacteria bacterium CG_4_10_14_0_8_um_filter_39_13]|uniref:GIY-YIG domain-containing protein n=1 Tax=Candidatus Jorgensenbacteria bacterium CG_4_10_14_0_8_um_filter_39_13 TaxID=1974589 RepID=A0A2M7RHM4_9BACT|nr:MAG: hypothetical protein COZ81_01135 [Candidatus Jorgensenbacteria bacterium CG_4_8_14_3_um_filter_38_10]PIY96001.1 MAG: hypothetical protein COY65_01815 [Candidatus Jorgensenbacteria bacterium CG_4_10_14_0_8_um_filter_39_13]PJA95102.1 MAG: hypothetical protein CO130_00980 [Candidatus Jorgensenbacteria bacterium CG_4_9_14_3_um_filter_38_10]
MKGYVYILKDRRNKFYIGSTTNLKRRLYQHSKSYTPTTHRMQKPTLVLVQECPTLKIARNIERKIKKLKCKDYIEKMIKDGYIKMTI